MEKKVDTNRVYIFENDSDLHRWIVRVNYNISKKVKIDIEGFVQCLLSDVLFHGFGEFRKISNL